MLGGREITSGWGLKRNRLSTKWPQGHKRKYIVLDGSTLRYYDREPRNKTPTRRAISPRPRHPGSAIDLRLVDALGPSVCSGAPAQALDLRVRDGKSSSRTYTFVLPEGPAWRLRLCSAVPAGALAAELAQECDETVTTRARPPHTEPSSPSHPHETSARNQLSFRGKASFGSSLFSRASGKQTRAPCAVAVDGEEDLSPETSPPPALRRPRSRAESLDPFCNPDMQRQDSCVSQRDLQLTLTSKVPKDTYWLKLLRARTLDDLYEARHMEGTASSQAAVGAAPAGAQAEPESAMQVRVALPFLASPPPHRVRTS